MEERVRRLERQVTRLRLVVVAVVAVGLVAAAPGMATFDEVRAERFVLVDGEGGERGWLTVEDGASPTLRLSANPDEPVGAGVIVSANGSGGALGVYAGEGEPRAGLGTLNRGAPALVLEHPDSNGPDVLLWAEPRTGRLSLAERGRLR